MEQVSAALNRRDANFLDGWFFGAFSQSMRYGGDTKALNGMLADLAACPGMILSVGFSTNSTGATDWTISNSVSQSNFVFRVKVSVKSTRLKLHELIIPAVIGPPITAVPGRALATTNAVPSAAPVDQEPAAKGGSLGRSL